MVTLRKLEDLTDLEKLALRPLSYSRLNTLDLCEQKYFHTYITKDERLFGPPAVLGNVLHSVMENTVGEPLSYGKSVGLMSDFLKKYDPDNLIDENLRQDGRVMLAEFVDKHKDDVFDVIEHEKEFEIIVGSGKILGYIDLVLNGPKDTIHIIDLKTGKWEVAQKNIHKDLQLGIYALAMSQEYPDTPIYAELYYMRSGKRKGHWFTPEDLERVHDEVATKIEDLVEKRSFKPTQNARICYFCDFAPTGVCPTGYARLKNKKY